jgi:hypothetical protein
MIALHLDHRKEIHELEQQEIPLAFSWHQVIIQMILLPSVQFYHGDHIHIIKGVSEPTASPS